jgi:hypothetical protein
LTRLYGVGDPDPMGEDLRASPVELTRLATDVLTASQQIRDSWANGQGDLAIPGTAFGNSNGANGVRDSHQATMDEGDVTIGRHVAVLEGDVDRLYRVAFAYEKFEEDEAVRIRKAAAGAAAGGVGGGP